MNERDEDEEVRDPSDLQGSDASEEGDDETFFWGIKGPESSFVRDLFRKLRAHSPQLCTALVSHLSTNPDRREPKAFDGQDAGALLLIHLLEAIVAFEQLKVEVMAQPHLSPSKGRVPASMLIAQSDLLQLEPALLHVTHLAYASRCRLWDQVPETLQPSFVTNKAIKAMKRAKKKDLFRG